MSFFGVKYFIQDVLMKIFLQKKKLNESLGLWSAFYSKEASLIYIIFNFLSALFLIRGFLLK